MPYPEDFCKISGNSVRRKIIKFDDFGIRDLTLLSGVLMGFHVATFQGFFRFFPVFSDAVGGKIHGSGTDNTRVYLCPYLELQIISSNRAPGTHSKYQSTIIITVLGLLQFQIIG